MLGLPHRGLAYPPHFCEEILGEELVGRRAAEERLAQGGGDRREGEQCLADPPHFGDMWLPAADSGYRDGWDVRSSQGDEWDESGEGMSGGPLHQTGVVSLARCSETAGNFAHF